MRFFVIGGSGFIGSAVCRQLQERGHELVGLARSDASVAKLAAIGIQPLRGALGDIEVLGEATRAADGIVQISTGGNLGNAAKNAEAALSSTDTLLKAIAGTDKPYIYTCGTGLWSDTGTIDPERVVTEDDPETVPYFYTHIGEIYRRMLAAAEHSRAIVIHPAMVYGRTGGPIGPITRMFDGVRKHGVVFVAPEDNAYTYVHVDDLADLYVRVLENSNARGSYFAAADDTVTTVDVAKAVSVAVGQSGDVVAVDHVALRRLNGRASEMDFWLNCRASGNKARAELGWTPVHPSVVADLCALPQPLDPNLVYPGR